MKRRSEPIHSLPSSDPRTHTQNRFPTVGRCPCRKTGTVAIQSGGCFWAIGRCNWVDGEKRSPPTWRECFRGPLTSETYFSEAGEGQNAPRGKSLATTPKKLVDRRFPVTSVLTPHPADNSLSAWASERGHHPALGGPRTSQPQVRLCLVPSVWHWKASCPKKSSALWLFFFLMKLQPCVMLAEGMARVRLSCSVSGSIDW